MLSRNRCASNAVIYSKLRLQTDLLLTYLYRRESCRECANPTARSGTPDRPMPAGCIRAGRGHRRGAAGHPPGLSLKDKQISFLHQHLTRCPVPPELQEGSRVTWVPRRAGWRRGLLCQGFRHVPGPGCAGCRLQGTGELQEERESWLIICCELGQAKLGALGDLPKGQQGKVSP